MEINHHSWEGNREGELGPKDSLAPLQAAAIGYPAPLRLWDPFCLGFQGVLDTPPGVNEQAGA